MNIEVIRRTSSPDNAEFRATTIGNIYLDGAAQGFTLEPTALMIPEGNYPVEMLWSERFQRKTPHLTVPGRTEIEIHGGNTATDSEGCILIAERWISDYEIAESKPATDAIEAALEQAEADSESNTVTVSSINPA